MKMSETLYILTRTSGRPVFFARMRETIKALDWPGPVCHIVHTDDPRDTYVAGDIIIRGETLGPSFGTGFYNLYQNRSLKAIPDHGWVHFIDDDDEYIGADALAFMPGQNKTALHVCKTRRVGVSKHNEIFPPLWKKQKTFQTECFVLWSDIAKQFNWWGNKGGDHHYTNKITRKHPIIWHDHIATQAQAGKGHGDCLDASGKAVHDGVLTGMVYFKMFASAGGRKQAQLLEVPIDEALILERHKLGRITYKGVNEVRI
jgi:hypothetical protein